MHFFTLLRHGESEGNSKGVLQGQLDYPLSPAGEKQAHNLAAFWRSTGINFDLIISSSLQRASQTAQVIAEKLKLPLNYDPLWKERNFGQLQGVSIDEISKRDPPVDFIHPYQPIGVDGESQLDLYAHASQAIQNILRLSSGPYLVVSHGAILNKALYVIMGITPQAHYHSPIFHFSNTGYAQLRYNSVSCKWAALSVVHQMGLEEGSDIWQYD